MRPWVCHGSEVGVRAGEAMMREMPATVRVERIMLKESMIGECLMNDCLYDGESNSTRMVGVEICGSLDWPQCHLPVEVYQTPLQVQEVQGQTIQ